MTHLARRLGLFDLPLVASLAVPAWAAGPVGLGYLKMGMNKSAIEQGDSSGAIKLLDPLQELKLPTKAPVADDYYTTQAVLPFAPDPVKLSLGFKGIPLRDQRALTSEKSGRTQQSVVRGGAHAA